MKTINAFKILVLAALLVPAVAAADSRNTFEEELSVPDALHLEVTTGSGSIDIDVGPGGSVSVVGKVKVNRRGLFRRRRSNCPATRWSSANSRTAALAGG